MKDRDSVGRSLSERIGSIHDVIDSGITGFRKYSVSTPAHEFTTFFYVDETGPGVLLFTLRDQLHELAVQAFSTHVLQFYPGNTAEQFVKMRVPALPVLGMDSVVFLPSGHHKQFAAQDPELNGLTTVCFPIHGCELPALLSSEELAERRQYYLASLDWGRTPQPYASMRYANPKTRGGTTGTGFCSTNVDGVLREAANLAGVEGGTLDVRNFEDASVHLEGGPAGMVTLCAESGVVGRQLCLSEATAWLVAFLESGRELALRLGDAGMR